ncbi:MAG TPA: NAD(P)-dependent oxidoreductase [Candidatus Pullichristensenella excrementipullorum]|nr:NAD(P)-dependent oxidoreductase [Candidatus Pullichristensenella excrementipullorum]
MRIGFIGVGVMGNGMVKNLLSHGYEVSAYTRTRAKALEALEAGAEWRESAADCVRDADAVITMVGFPPDVEEVYFGERGILANARPGTLVIDMTTTSPRLAQRIYTEAADRGLSALDAPVSGGDTGARAGTLAIMVGGDREAFERAVPIFEAMGKSIRYMGAAGSGQHTKMANQIAIAGTLAGVCEAIAYARAAGLDVDEVISTISGGAASSWQLANNGPKSAHGDFAPGFFIKHFIKDMTLADGEARARDLPMPVLEKVLAMFRALEAQGYGDEGTQALIRAYRS